MNEISAIIDRIINITKNYDNSFERDLHEFYELLKRKISSETRPEVIVEALNRDISDLLYLYVPFMFQAYQKAIKLDPLNEKLIKDFLFYLEIVSGPDWEEEIGEIRKYLDNKQIEQAAKVALQVDYNKWD